MILELGAVLLGAVAFWRFVWRPYWRWIYRMMERGL